MTAWRVVIRVCVRACVSQKWAALWGENQGATCAGDDVSVQGPRGRCCAVRTCPRTHGCALRLDAGSGERARGLGDVCHCQFPFCLPMYPAPPWPSFALSLSPLPSVPSRFLSPPRPLALSPPLSLPPSLSPLPLFPLSFTARQKEPASNTADDFRSRAQPRCGMS